MPIYEYRCKSCGQHAEIIQKVGERPRRKCEHCGGRLEKLVSRTAFLLKGGGWYSEGYSRSGGDKDKKEKKEKKETAGTGSADAKREPKSGGESKSGGGSGNGKRSASGVG